MGLTHQNEENSLQHEYMLMRLHSMLELATGRVYDVTALDTPKSMSSEGHPLRATETASQGTNVSGKGVLAPQICTTH